MKQLPYIFESIKFGRDCLPDENRKIQLTITLSKASCFQM